MGGLEDSVLSLLRPSEELKTVLETQLLSPVNASLAASSTTASRSENYNSEDTTETRILAVVSHHNDWSVSEEGRCVSFLFMRSDLGRSSVLNRDYRTTLPLFPVFQELCAWACGSRNPGHAFQ
jgi:phosphatidylinositol-bisphosphatase